MPPPFGFHFSLTRAFCLSPRSFPAREFELVLEEEELGFQFFEVGRLRAGRRGAPFHDLGDQVFRFDPFVEDWASETVNCKPGGLAMLPIVSNEPHECSHMYTGPK